MADGDALLLEIQKWGIVLIMFIVIMFVLIKTRRGVPGSSINQYSTTCYLFAFASWLVVTVSSFIRDSMSDEKTESFKAFIPNFILTILWFVFVSSALTWKLSGQQLSDIRSPVSFGKKVVIGGKMKRRGGGQGTVAPESVGLTVRQVQNAAVYLVGMGILMTIINVIGTLYIYYGCKSSNCEDDDVIVSLVGAQYNIIIIGIMAVCFIYFTKHRQQKSVPGVSS